MEKARAGDKCVFTGTLIAVPDVSKLRVGSNTSLVRDAGANASEGPRRNKELENDILSFFFSFFLFFPPLFFL